MKRGVSGGLFLLTVLSSQAISVQTQAEPSPKPAVTTPKPAVTASPELPGTLASNLTVQIDDIKNQEGQVCISLFQDGQGFPGNSKQSTERRCLDITNRPIVTVFKDVKPGEYAITVFHDVNKDGNLNQTSIGIPTEGIGFSNNIQVQISRPQFKEAAFNVAGPNTKLRIQMKYFLNN
jgi:uncharacterized protein (DUF2141 family)